VPQAQMALDSLFSKFLKDAYVLLQDPLKTMKGGNLLADIDHHNRIVQREDNSTP
jgi:hypothetical protein